MDVDDATREGFYQEVGHQGQETCQHDKLDVVLLEQWHHHLRVVKLGFGSHSRWYAQIGGTYQTIGVGLVADYQSTVDALAVCEILDEILTVCAAAGHKDGYIDSVHNSFNNSSIRRGTAYWSMSDSLIQK